EIKPGMLLIIEEPESHLHPAMQVKLTNQIAKLVNEGIRVVVTTHSEWVIEALSNIVHRSKIAKEFNENTSSNKIALKEDQVGVWYFKNNRRKKGTVVKEIKLGKSITGQYPTGYDRVAINLHNEWVGIANIVENS
ncbi:MAG: AAA family ATPase, partial [Rhodobacteraceae bacterium]|nr:AAA family ATPase [Paracoccaceae bacterium]